MDESEKELEKMYDHVDVMAIARCAKCRQTDEMYDIDDFYHEGWRVKRNRMLCPKCVNATKQ